MALFVMMAPVLALAVGAGLIFAAEIDRAKSKRPRRYVTVPPALRRRTIPGVIDPRS